MTTVVMEYGVSRRMREHKGEQFTPELIWHFRVLAELLRLRGRVDRRSASPGRLDRARVSARLLCGALLRLGRRPGGELTKLFPDCGASPAHVRVLRLPFWFRF